MDRRLTEQLETLAGLRRLDAKGKAAVLIEDLAPLLELPPSLRSARAAGAAPTKAEHDALVADIAALHQRLEGVKELLQIRLNVPTIETR